MASTKAIQRKQVAAAADTNPKPMHNQVPAVVPLLKVDQAAYVPRSWPTSPKPVKSSLFAIVLTATFDFALLACAVVFLSFAITVYRYDQAPIADNPIATRRLQSASTYGPTVLPILFASIIGQVTHAILLWRLESGERVGILDTLAASTSLTSTVTSQIHVRMISVLGGVLVSIWALSPIGGQASIRQMSIGTRATTESAVFRYMAPNGYFIAFQASAHWHILLDVNGLFMGALMASWDTRSSPRDTWGNVKIPKIESYEKMSRPDKEGWYRTDQISSALETYHSFVGIPIDGNMSNKTTTDYYLRLQTPYLNVQCAYTTGALDKWRWKPNTSSERAQGASLWWSSPEHLNRIKTATNITLAQLKPFNFTYVGSFDLDCDLTTTYVETEVSCVAGSTCQATKVRRSQLNSLPPAWTAFDSSMHNWILFAEGFMSVLGELKTSPWALTLFERYLLNPRLSIQNSGSEDTQDPTKITNEEYSHRFGQLLNSYSTCMNGIYALTEGINNKTSYFWDDNISCAPPLMRAYDGTESLPPKLITTYNWTGDPYRKSRVWPTEGTRVIRTEVIVAHKAWVILLSVSSFVLILSCLISIYLRYFVQRGPDVAVNFSSLATRHNAYVPLPSTGTYLDAATRARLLGNLKVRLGDVDGSAEVGSLALGSYGAEEAGLTAIRKGRLYE